MSNDLSEVQPQGDDRYGTTGAVVTRIGNELVVYCKRRPRHDLREVVRLHDGLGPVAQLAVAQLEPQPTCREVVGMGIAQPVRRHADADAIITAPPPRAPDLRT